MARPARSRLASLAVLLTAALSAAGCVSMPTGGPVQSYPMTQATDAQNQPYVQFQPQPPGAGWDPQKIVEGFLTASASFGSYQQVALQYLTASEQQEWKRSNPTWSAVVYKSGPDVTVPDYPAATAKNATTATVKITGTIQATLTGNDNYSVASSAKNDPYTQESFQLQRGRGGQWRISSAPNELLLTSSSFANDYQLRNLYFFDPMSRYLVPDPVYVPLGAKPEDLMNVLVRGLITPPDDWLSGATKTALPRGTKIGDVTLDGVTVIVNLTGGAIGRAASSKAGTRTMEQVSAQLLSTLSGAAQTGTSEQPVQSVQVEVNGKPWTPPGSQAGPVQNTPKWRPAPGKSSSFYYVDGSGYLISRRNPQGTTVRLARIGTGYSKVAVSPDGTYVAALRGHTLYAGLVNGSLTRQSGTYVAMSWDVDDDLWASTGTQIVLFRGSVNARRPLGQMVSVAVVGPGSVPPFTDIQVAPDGVRVAIVQDNDTLTFGAISGQQGANPQISLSLVQETPPASASGNAKFTSLAWYGADNVITLAQPGPAVTEYSVSGGTTSISAAPGMTSISASSSEPLIAGLPNGRMMVDASVTGSWMPVGDGDTPAIGSAPTYPG